VPKASPANYAINFSAQALRKLRKLKSDQAVLKSIWKTIDTLKIDPRKNGAEKLANSESMRIRDGSYRIVFDINDSNRIVTVQNIADRKDVYRQ